MIIFPNQHSSWTQKDNVTEPKSEVTSMVLMTWSSIHAMWHFMLLCILVRVFVFLKKEETDVFVFDELVIITEVDEI